VIEEEPFPCGNQRNTWESLSKAKRKVLLLQNGAATDQSLLGRAQLGLKSTQVIFLVQLHVLPEDCSLLGPTILCGQLLFGVRTRFSEAVTFYSSVRDYWLMIFISGRE
jgi:hypothetical protein